MDRRRRPWSDLPVHILHLFLDRLYFDDRDRFAAVCKPWCSAVAGHRSPPVPLLTLYDGDDPKYVLLLSPAEDGKIRRLKIPAGIVGRGWHGSSHGWLFNDNDILFNPFTKEQIKLPPSTAGCRSSISNLMMASMSSVGATVGGGMFAAFRLSSELAFCRLGDETWSNYFRRHRFSDFLFFQGLLYCIDSMARLFVLELGANPKIKERYHPAVRGTSCRPPLEMISLVLRGEEILMVVRSGQTGSPIIRTTLGFDVFRLNPSRTEWVPVKNLGGWTLFLSFYSSLALEASKYPAFKPNCIFFSDLAGCYLFFMEDGTFRPYPFLYSKSLFSMGHWLLHSAA